MARALDLTDLLIASFISYEKEQKGLPSKVKRSEVAKVKCAYASVEHRYPEKQKLNVIRLCCQTFVDSEMKNITSPIALMISKYEFSTVPFSEMPISESKGRK